MNAAGARIDRASRLIAASAERVYAAFVDRAAVAAWLPPAGASGTIEAFAPEPGGAFRMTLRFAAMGSAGKTTPDSDTIDGRFVGLVPGSCVVQEFDFVSDDPAFAGTMRMTWSLVPQGDATAVTVMAEHVPAGIDPEDHAQGLASSLANLAAFVEGGST